VRPTKQPTPKACTAFTGAIARVRRCRSCYNVRADGRQRRRADAGAPGADPEHRRGGRKRRATSHRCATSAARCRPDFIVLSGRRCPEMPLMAVGGRGSFRSASNEIPAEMVQMVEAAEGNDFAAGPAGSRSLPAADADQLRRGEPDSGEGRDGAIGSARRCVPAADGSTESGVSRRSSACSEWIAEGERSCRERFQESTQRKRRAQENWPQRHRDQKHSGRLFPRLIAL